MSDFSVKTANLNKEANDIKSICNSVNAIGEALNDISSGLRISSFSSMEIRHRLKVIHENIIDEAVKMDSLSNALNTAAELYKKAETNVINGNFSDENYSAATTAAGVGTAIMITQWMNQVQETVKTILLELGIIKPQEQRRVEGQQVTQLQQTEHDLYMQSEISKLRSKPRYSDSTWQKASLEERKSILTDYISEVSEIMGLDYDEIRFDYLEPQNGYVTNGSYSRSRDEIMLNEYVIENSSSPQKIFSTTQHELRHAYQYKVCENPEKFVVTDSTAAAWQKSFDEYKDTNGFMREGMSSSEAYQAYRNQAVEKDARKFARQS